MPHFLYPPLSILKNTFNALQADPKAYSVPDKLILHDVLLSLSLGSSPLLALSHPARLLPTSDNNNIVNNSNNIGINNNN